MHTNGSTVIAGIFAGYSENLGASKKVDVINTSKNDTENLEGGEEVLDTEREL